MAYCKNCGTPLREGSVFCENCGTRVISNRGRDLAMVSFLVGIISTVIALEVFILSIVAHFSQDLADNADGFFKFVPIYAAFPIVAIIISMIARARGSDSRQGKVGFTLGIASLIAVTIGTLSFVLVLGL